MVLAAGDEAHSVGKCISNIVLRRLFVHDCAHKCQQRNWVAWTKATSTTSGRASRPRREDVQGETTRLRSPQSPSVCHVRTCASRDMQAVQATRLNFMNCSDLVHPRKPVVDCNHQPKTL